jgi:hypothetical protein
MLLQKIVIKIWIYQCKEENVTQHVAMDLSENGFIVSIFGQTTQFE